jgi:hypothetical protein
MLSVEVKLFVYKEILKHIMISDLGLPIQHSLNAP